MLSPNSKGQAWFCTIGLPSDVVVEVDNMSFHLHKFPLMSKSRKFHQLITEQAESKDAAEDEHSSSSSSRHHISLQPDFAARSDTFEMALKFCYGIKIHLNSSNVVPLRCAAEYLEMTEEIAEDNLMSLTQSYLSQSVLANIKDSVTALKSCEQLLPFAEHLGIPQQCIEAIVDRVNSKLFRQQNANGSSVSSSASYAASALVNSSWFEDLTVLSLPMYERVISAMRAKGVKKESIEGALVYYAKRSIPWLSRSSRRRRRGKNDYVELPESEQRDIVETVIMNLPLPMDHHEEGRARGRSRSRFLFDLLRTINILRASEDCRKLLEMKTASQLERATVDDLLIPNYSSVTVETTTLYDVECVERIISCFLKTRLRLYHDHDHDHDHNNNSDNDDQESNAGTMTMTSMRSAANLGDGGGRRLAEALVKVGKLLDGYLAEIAADTNLKPDQFCHLASLLPHQARHLHDALYRAVDLYLEAHPGLNEEEREKVLSVLDIPKLTPEACTHASLNERLPLRVTVKVLSLEQLQLQQSIMTPEQQQQQQQLLEELPLDHHQLQAHQGPRNRSNTWRSIFRENQVLQLDMDSMQGKLKELERQRSNLRRVMNTKKMDRDLLLGGNRWSSFANKFGCKFKTQVSHQPVRLEHPGKIPIEVQSV